jgi:(R,R)-butanediol dehydrogenase/meso-butanediol dehydrogenase/diacetyl reductase
MEREAIVVYADHDPISGVPDPRPNQTFRHPRVTLERRALDILAPDWIRVEMLYGGVCGTDLHLVQSDPRTGYIQTSSPASIPREGRIIGHEGIGRIVEVGSAVRHLRSGACVAFESILACHHCEPCRRGLFNQCRNGQLLGMERDGLFATIADVPASAVHDVSEFVNNDDDARSLTNLEPASVALLACHRARISARDRVVIFGAGPIGTYCAILARIAFGAGRIDVVEPLKFRREFAAKWADQAHTPEDFLATCSDPVDVVIEASGDLRSIDNVIRMMDADGRIVLLARSGEPLVINATDHIITNAISIVGSRGHLGGSFNTILKLYAQKRFNPAEIVTGVVDGMEKLRELLSSPAEVVHDHCKVLVKLNGTGRSSS